MCKFCDNLEYKEITIPSRTTGADHNVCEIASPQVIEIDGEIYKSGSECEGCYGCAKENNYWQITICNNDIVDLHYYNKVRDFIIDQYSARFCINFCPMCGKRISKELHEDLKFW